MNRRIMQLNAPEPPKLPQHQIRLGGPTIQNISRIVENEKPELTLEERMEMMVFYIRTSVKYYDHVKIQTPDMILSKNYPQMLYSIFISMQSRVRFI